MDLSFTINFVTIQTVLGKKHVSLCDLMSRFGIDLYSETTDDNIHLNNLHG